MTTYIMMGKYSTDAVKQISGERTVKENQIIRRCGGTIVKDAMPFAGVRPVGLRALFVSDWDTDEPGRPFEDRAAMTREVQALRAEHNFAPETAIRDVASALRRHVDRDAFDQVLGGLPEGAAEFWKP